MYSNKKSIYILIEIKLLSFKWFSEYWVWKIIVIIEATGNRYPIENGFQYKWKLSFWILRMDFTIEFYCHKIYISDQIIYGFAWILTCWNRNRSLSLFFLFLGGNCRVPLTPVLGYNCIYISVQIFERPINISCIIIYTKQSYNLHAYKLYVLCKIVLVDLEYVTKLLLFITNVRLANENLHCICYKFYWTYATFSSLLVVCPGLLFITNKQVR